MKKNELYELYKVLNVSNEEITSILNEMIELKGIDAHLFYITCINNSDVLTDDNFYNIFKVFLYLCYLNDISIKQEFCDMFDEFISRDYIISLEYFEDIITIIEKILDFPISSAIFVEEDEEDYYILKFIEYYFKLLYRNQYDYENVYKHDLEFLSLKYYELIKNLFDTEIGDMYNFNESILKRIELFIDIATDDRVLNLDDNKYQSVIEVALSINNINDLARFKNRIKVLSDKKTDIEYRKIIENYTSELNENTIKIILEELQEKNKDETEEEKLKKILIITERENKIIKIE